MEVAIKVMRANDEEELHGRRQEFEILKRFLGLKRQHQNARRVRKLRLSLVLRVRFLSQHQGFSAFSASSMHCFFPVFLSYSGVSGTGSGLGDCQEGMRIVHGMKCLELEFLEVILFSFLPQRGLPVGLQPPGLAALGVSLLVLWWFGRGGWGWALFFSLCVFFGKVKYIQIPHSWSVCFFFEGFSNEGGIIPDCTI